MDNHVINNKTLTEGLFYLILIKIFYMKLNKNDLGKVLNNIVKFTHINEEKSVPIYCNRADLNGILKNF